MHLLWITNYLEDLEADFRVFYRIDDFNEIDGPMFFRLAMRVGAYQGVIAARMAKEEQERDGGVQPRSQHGPIRDNERKRVEASPVALGIAAPGWFTFKTAKAEKKD